MITLSRGAIWLRSSQRQQGDSKIRPVVLLSNTDRNSVHRSVIVIPFTSDVQSSQNRLSRILVQPSPQNGLEQYCWIVCDEPQLILKAHLREHIGFLEDSSLEVAFRFVVDEITGP